ncbi:MAG: flagellar filament capping protein FliD [Candidatus Methylomirabilia bacterium]
MEIAGLSFGSGATPAQIAELADRLLTNDRKPLEFLQAQQSFLTERSSVLGTLRTKLISLKGVLDDLLSPGTLSPFSSRTATSSDTSILTAAATSSATPGAHSLVVTQLAQRSQFASDVFTDTDSTIATKDRTDDFRLTIDGTDFDLQITRVKDETDLSVLTKVADAINAGTNGEATALVVTTETGKSRISLTSTETGTANNITLSDISGGKILQDTGLDRPGAATDTQGGFIVKDQGGNELDAKFSFNGLNLIRESNTISDVVPGLTIDLKSADAAQTVTVNVDPAADSILDKIKDFVTKFNEVVDFLNENSKIDTEGGNHGILFLDPVFSGLGSQLRLEATTLVNSAASGDPNSLAALGIRQGADGKLSISDESDLKALIESDPTAVATVFNATTDGVATKLDDFVDDFTGAAGHIGVTQNQLSIRIQGLDRQISRQEEILELKKVRLQTQLARDQQVIIALTQQLNQVKRFFGAFTGT